MNLNSCKFSKEDRLLKRPQFKLTLDNGRKAVSHELVFISLDNNFQRARLGLIVSKKVGGAVVRNKVKRRLREIFRHKLERLPGLDIVLIARHQAADASCDDLSSAFDHCLRRLHKKTIP